MILHLFKINLFYLRSIVKITMFSFIVNWILNFTIFIASNFLFSNFFLNFCIIALLIENCWFLYRFSYPLNWIDLPMRFIESTLSMYLRSQKYIFWSSSSLLLMSQFAQFGQLTGRTLSMLNDSIIISIFFWRCSRLDICFLELLLKNKLRNDKECRK